MRSSDHPRSCRVCRGTGWQPGEPRFEIVDGRRVRYDTCAPCQHHWANDETTRQEPAPHPSRGSGIAEANIERGRAELRAIRGEPEPEQSRLDL
jgi:hypothetical protein